MNQEERVKYWIDVAEYDYDTAKVMLKSGRRLYVAFMCHQVVEKMLKATGVQHRRKNLPTFTI